MTPIVIDAKNRGPFQSLISRRVWALLDQPGTLALGVVDESGLASGALVCQLDGAGTAELLWLFTAENRRRQGAADQLLYTLRRALKGQGYQRLCCLMPDDEETDDVFQLLLAHGFVFSPAATDLTTVPLKELAEYLKKAGVQVGQCRPLAQIPKGYIRMALNKLGEEKLETIAPLLDRSAGLYALHPCSCGIVEGDHLAGMMLFVPREDENGVALVLTQAAKPAMAVQLLYCAAVEAQKLCPPDALFTLATLDGQGERIGSLLGESAQATPMTWAELRL